MATADGGHVFNSDLLANEHDRDKVRDLYPSLEDVLYHQELIDTFTRYNVVADDAKKRSRTLGKLAITLGGFAIGLAAIEVAMGIGEGGGPVRTLLFGFLAALCGILSIVIGAFGILFGDKKRKWLHSRFMGERIRQFHFQSLIVQFPEVAGLLLSHGDKAAKLKAKFLSDRARLFRRFLGEYEGNPGKFTGVVGPDGEKEVWVVKPEPEIAARRAGHNDLVDIDKLHLALKELERELEGESGARHRGGAEKGKHGPDHRPDLDLFFQAYLDMRINHQVGYTNYKLENDHKIFSESPVRQAEVLETISKAGVAWLFLIHAVVLVIAGTALAQISFAVNGIDARTLVSYIFSAAIIAIAMVALLVRAFQQGLQPEREAERYQQYRSALLRVREQFEAAETPMEKLDSMRQVERVSFDEMRNFLISNERVSFVV
jgi:hypothetical protein